MYGMVGSQVLSSVFDKNSSIVARARARTSEMSRATIEINKSAGFHKSALTAPGSLIKKPGLLSRLVSGKARKLDAGLKELEKAQAALKPVKKDPLKQVAMYGGLGLVGMKALQTLKPETADIQVQKF